jgi:hypothetical protein
MDALGAEDRLHMVLVVKLCGVVHEVSLTPHSPCVVVAANEAVRPSPDLPFAPVLCPADTGASRFLSSSSPHFGLLRSRDPATGLEGIALQVLVNSRYPAIFKRRHNFNDGESACHNASATVNKQPLRPVRNYPVLPGDIIKLEAFELEVVRWRFEAVD